MNVKHPLLCSRTVLFISVDKHYIKASLSFGRHLVYNMLFPDVQGYQENKIWVKQIPSKLTILSLFIQVAVHVRKVCICVLGIPILELFHLLSLRACSLDCSSSIYRAIFILQYCSLDVSVKL